MPPVDPPDPSFSATLDRIRQAAPRRDQNGDGLGEEIGWLRDLGLLAAALPETMSDVATWSEDPLAMFDLLRRIGATSMPVARLFEGHVNAAQLIGLYASPSLRQRCATAVRAGALLGVWGADGEPPLVAATSDNGFILSGSKSFCSGLGLVETALVSAWMGDHTRLFCVDVRDTSRADHAQWQVSGMRATRSGGYDFDGMVLAPDAAVGGPDAFYAEPYFLGGMYRMCAVQTGGLDELLDQVAASLRTREKAAQPLAQLRVGQIASERALAAHTTQALARRIADAAPPHEIAREAILMREGVERCIVSALAITERCLGTEVHRETTAVSRLRRDLSVYMRQAAVDERLMSVGSWYLT
jgi:hypothetical protein